MTGYVKYYECSSCHYGEQFVQGPGFLVRPQSFPEYIAGNHRLFHYKIHEKIINLANRYQALLISATYQVYKCPTCGILFNKSKVNMVSDDMVLHVNEFKCTRCRRRLKPTNINRLRRAVCPVCLKPSFLRQKENDLLWSSVKA